MESRIVCADTDPQWLEERRKRVTASDMMCFLGRQPDWWSTNWDEILGHKLRGAEREMDMDGTVNVTHGRLTEALNMELTGQLLGFPVTPHKYLYESDRWPNLGASLDGLLWPGRGVGPDLDLTTHVGLTAELVEALDGLPEGRPVMVESKNARHPDPYGSKRKKGQLMQWGDKWPEYHEAQVQTGMWIADFDYCVLSGRLGGRDMACHLIPRDPAWERILDEANERAGEVLR